MQCSPTLPKKIVDDEPGWRVLRQTSGAASPAPTVIATRWRAGCERALEFDAEAPTDFHVVMIVLRTMNIRFSVSGHLVQDGVTTRGTVHVTEPTMPVRCLFR